jgi:tetratricopeptide (TPR) repeat protein
MQEMPSSALETSAAAAAARRPPRLFGRDDELDELLAAVDAALTGQGSVVLIAGEAGVGKTLLVEEAAARAGRPVLWSTCWEGEGAPAFWPWTQLLRALLSGDDGEWLRRSAGAEVAEVGRLLGETGAKGRGGDTRFRLFDSVGRLLRLSADRNPLVLVIDDLHWADEPSIRLLQFLARDLHGSRLVVVATYRDTDVDDLHPLVRCLDDLVKAGRHLALRGLEEPELREFLASLLGGEAPVQMAAILRDRTGGNPFFIRELVRLLRAEGRLFDVGARSSLVVPDSVRAVLARRLARISHSANDVLVAAAVAGTEFDVAVVGSVAAQEPAAVLAALEEARRARLVVEVPGAVGRFRFAHALVREVLYEGLSLPARARLHRRAGEAIEARGVDESKLAELAHHFLQGAASDGMDKGVAYAARAGAHAHQLLAYEEAAGWYERALDGLRLDRSGDARREGELLLALGEARLAAGDPRARDAYVRAAELARQRADAQQLAEAALGLGAGLAGFEVHLFDRSQIELLEEALRELEPGDSRLRAWLLARLSVALSFVESDQRRRELSEEAVTMARRVGDGAALGYALAAHCDAIAGPEHSEDRQREAEEVIRLSGETDDPPLELLGRRIRIVALLELGRVAEADAEIDAFELVAESLRQPLYRWYVPLWRGMRALMRGDVAESARR